MLNSASRSRSLVGRTASDFGPSAGASELAPDDTHYLASMDAVRRNGRDAGPSYLILIARARSWSLVLMALPRIERKRAGRSVV